MHRFSIFPLLALCLLFAAACSDQSDTGESPSESTAGRATILGELTYRQRIALPDDATATVALVDLGRSANPGPATTIAAINLSDFQQVPIAFSLTFPSDAIDAAHKYALRASILDASGQILWRAPQTTEIDPLNDAEKHRIVMQQASRGRTFAFACKGLKFQATVTPATAVLKLDNRMLELPSVRSASGAKYSDGDTVFWSKGQDSALLELDGQTYKNCRAER